MTTDARDSEEPRPSRMELRTGIRPHTEFGHDDKDVDAELVELVTDDHKHWDALLLTPRSDREGRAGTLAIVIHGSLGNYMGGVPRRLSFEMSHAGYSVLSINTRMANFGPIYGGGLFDEAHRDVGAAVQFGRALGFERMVLVGYSLGASIATDYLADHHPDEVVGLCTLAHPWSLPESQRRRWDRLGARPSYSEVARMARREGIANGADDGVVVIHRGAGPTDAPADAEAWSLRAWLQCRGPEASRAVSVDRIGQVGVPVALIQAGSDPVLPGNDGDNLAQAARRAGLEVHLEHIDGADHTFWGQVPDAARRAVAWMDALPGAGTAPSPAARPHNGTVRLFTITAADGELHDALFECHQDAVEERAARTGHRTAIVHLHGNQGNLTVGALRWLRRPVAASGLPVLTLDTRIGNVSQLFGTAVVEDVLLDVQAATEWLAREGYDQVVVSGYSLGASTAIYCAAHDLALPLAGLVAMGTAWSLPEGTKWRMEQCGAAPTYDELVTICRPYADAAPDDDISLVVHSMYLPEDTPRSAGVFTARTWWHSRGPEATAAMAHLNLPRVKAPVLLVQGDADVLVNPADAERLAERARADGNVDVTVAMLPGVGHEFGDHDATFGALRDWFDARV